MLPLYTCSNAIFLLLLLQSGVPKIYSSSMFSQEKRNYFSFCYISSSCLVMLVTPPVYICAVVMPSSSKTETECDTEETLIFHAARSCVCEHFTN